MQMNAKPCAARQCLCTFECTQRMPTRSRARDAAPSLHYLHTQTHAAVRSRVHL